MTLIPARMKDESGLDAFLEEFESGSLPKCEWTHATHLGVATCYLLSYPDDEVLNRLRTRIRFLNDCHGTVNSIDSGYHETLTRFWLIVLRRFLNTLPKGTPRIVAVEQVILAFGERRNIYAAYYTFEVVKNHAARRSWIPPDRERLD